MEEAALAQLNLSKVAATSSLEALFVAPASLITFWEMLRGGDGLDLSKVAATSSLEALPLDSASLMAF